MLSYLEARTEPRDNVRPMGFACEYRQPAVPDRNERLLWLVRCVTATRTVDPAGRAVVEEVGATVGREPAEGPELLEVIVTPDERDRQLVNQQKREVSPSRRPKGGFAGGTLDELIPVGSIRC